MTQKNNRTLALVLLNIFLIVLGALFCVLKSSIIGLVVNIFVTVLGVMLIVYGILRLVNKICDFISILSIVFGACMILFGWIFEGVILTLLAVLIIIYGVEEIILYNKTKAHFMLLINGIIYIVIGIMVIFGRYLLLDWLFVVTGIFMICDGCIGIFDSIMYK